MLRNVNKNRSIFLQIVASYSSWMFAIYDTIASPAFQLSVLFFLKIWSLPPLFLGEVKLFLVFFIRCFLTSAFKGSPWAADVVIIR